MKKTILSFLYSILFLKISLFAGSKNSESALKAQARDLLKTQSVQFLENQGQMTDMAGHPVPFVLFKIEAPGLDLFITEQGLTYVFKTSKEESTPLSFGEGQGGEAKIIDWERLDMTLQGANIKKANIIRENPTQGHFNYFYPHCPNGIYGVKEYEKVTIKNIYPGIDWVFYNSTNKGFKYDFVVHPGADHNQIQLVYSSKEKLNISPTGTLEAKTKYGNLSEQAPETFYEGQPIASRFKYLSTSENKYGGYDISIGFELPDFSPSPSGRVGEGLLIIDPQLVWATFYGSNHPLFGPWSMDTDNDGNVFITGYTGFLNGVYPFPGQDAGTYYQGTALSATTTFILKFDNTGKRLWATLYSGSGGEECNSITTDVNGNVFVTGWTGSPDFPLQDAGTFFQGTLEGGMDAFILKFDNLGNRLWATLYGGRDADVGNSITTDISGNVFVTGKTASTNFPAKDAGTFFQGTYGGGQGGMFNPYLDDAFILKFDNSGNRLWATVYGGNNTDVGNSITTDINGNVFVTGYTYSTTFPVQDAGTYFQGTYGGGVDASGWVPVDYGDAFILKFDNVGNRLWATFYGGSGFNGWGADEGKSIITDRSGNIFVTGYTTATNFPVQDAGTYFQGTYAGGSDIFILKFDNLGNRFWATYYGGLEEDGQGSNDNLVVDACGNIYMSFETPNSNMATQASCDMECYYDSTYNGGIDIFITQFSNSGTVLWATYLGGNGNDIREPMAMDAMGNLFVSGEWNENSGTITSATYPLTDAGGGSYFDNTQNGGDDGFVVKFIPSSPSAYTAGIVLENGDCCNGSATVNISGGNELYNYFWSNGKQTINTSSTTDSISHLCAGTYSVIVESIESACGASGTADIIYFTVVPLQECEDSVIVPNIFTPNGDDINDYFVLKDIDKYPENKLIIYNRWGEKIQEFTAYKNTWTADDIPDGVYYYALYLSDDNEPQSGFITIVR